jgi:hypothetical protein
MMATSAKPMMARHSAISIMVKADWRGAKEKRTSNIEHRTRNGPASRSRRCDGAHGLSRHSSATAEVTRPAFTPFEQQALTLAATSVSAFDVGCWMLDVRCFSIEVPRLQDGAPVRATELMKRGNFI